MPQPEPDPSDRRKAQIARINELSQLARTAWFSLLAYLVFVGITLLGVEDADFFLASRQTQLPLVSVQIPTASFFWTAPVLGAALYTYLHLFLIKLWDAHGEARTSDADPTHHWLVGDFVLLRQGDPVARARPLAWLTDWITRFLVWASGPIVLAYAWWRSMPAHAEWLTLLIAACLFLALVVGFTSWWRAEERLAAHARAAPWSARWQRVAMVFLGLVLTAVSVLRTEYERFLAPANLVAAPLVPLPDHWLTAESARSAYWETWCRREGLSMDVCGQTRGRQGKTASLVAARRTLWCEAGQLQEQECKTYFNDLEAGFALAWSRERAGMLANTRRIDLRGRDLRHASARGIRLVKGDLSGARLEGADLRLALLESSDLTGSRLTDADLYAARLDWASLDDAQLEEARLVEASMTYAWLYRTNLRGAYLAGARLDGATLWEAELVGADLQGARLDGADLGDARLQGAKLAEATLVGARLFDTVFDGADVRYVDFRSSEWDGHTSPRAPVHAADFRGARGMTQAQLRNAIGNEETLLPQGNAPDTGQPWFIWSCWDTPPADFDRIVANAAELWISSRPPAQLRPTDSDRARLRAEFLCSPDNPRRKTGTPLALDAPYPEGHPLAGRH